MKNLAIVNGMSSMLNKTCFQLKKHSPEILVVTGVVGVVTSAVMACRATLKINEVVSNAKSDIERIHTAEESGVTEAGEIYDHEDSVKDLTIVYTQTGLKVARLYAPSVILGALSITSILASNNILRKRNIALGAAYAAIDQSFKEYRSRVIERWGETVDRELKYGIRKEKVEETVADPETGKSKKVKNTIDVIDCNHVPSGYARFFDEGSRYYEKDAEQNLMFLRSEQNYANDRLRARGYLFLNEVYERLGIPTTKAGQIVGWIYDKENPNGDNFVDFGIYDATRPKNRDFVNGYERVILLDFNVDGDILDLIAHHNNYF